MKKSLRFEVFRRDSFACRYCGGGPPDVVLEVDHVLPRIEGGTDDPLNLVTSCYECNRGKGRRPLDRPAPDQDADIEYLALQQEIGEIERYQRALAARSEALRSLGDSFFDLWCEVSGLDWGPNDLILQSLIARYEPTIVEYAIRDVAPKVATGYITGWKWIPYLRAVARRAAENGAGEL